MVRRNKQELEELRNETTVLLRERYQLEQCVRSENFLPTLTFRLSACSPFHYGSGLRPTCEEHVPCFVCTVKSPAA